MSAAPRHLRPEDRDALATIDALLRAHAEAIRDALSVATGEEREGLRLFHMGELVAAGLDRSVAGDLLHQASTANGLVADIGTDAVQAMIAEAFAAAASIGVRALADVETFCRRFIAYPSEHAAVAHVLWIAHTHAMQAWDSTPRLAALSPEPGSGKTRLLEVTAALVPRPIEAVNVTPAYLFRKVAEAEDELPTLLHDEIDTIFGARAKEHEETRGFINAGHRKGAVAGRCVIKGKRVETEEIPAYCPVAVAGLGDLPDTILSRSVVLRMRRRACDERVEPWRARIHEPQGHSIREDLEHWMRERFAQPFAWPEMPEGVADRDADVWEPLLTVADAAGGDWPSRARRAAVALVREGKERAPSLGVRLLGDIRKIFQSYGTDNLATAVLLPRLHEMDDAPWGDLRGKPLADIGLSKLLRPYGIKPRAVRIGDCTPRGYRAADFADAWRRYLPAIPPEPATPATPATENEEP